MFKLHKAKQSQKAPPTKEPFVFKPNKGQQTKYFKTVADITIYGGAASGGKTWALLMDALQGVNYPNYEAGLFRATLPMHKMAGGLRNESKKYYPKAGGDFNETEMEWRWSNGARIKLYSCDNPSKYDGLQVAFLGLDQLEQFTAGDFFHLISRVRSDSEAPRKIRATVNPEPGWLADLLKSGGWVDADGWPIDKMDGVVRYFVREADGDALVWSDTKEGLGDKASLATSLTFIRARPEDNPVNLANNPDYLARLDSLPYVERMKKRWGNWNAKASAGTIFRGAWWGMENGRLPEIHPAICHAPPPSLGRCRAWDIGWSETGDPSVGVRVGQDESGWYIEDAIRFRSREAVTLEVIKRVAAVDGPDVPIILPRDPGKGGIDQTMWALELGALGYEVHCINDREWGDKIARCRYAAPQCELGHVRVCTTHPSREVALWLSTQETQPGSGRFVDCSTTLGWQQQLVEALDALAVDCPHSVTDWTDAFSKGFNYLTQIGGVVSSQIGAAARQPPTEARRQLEKHLVPAWSRSGSSANRKRSFWG